MAKAGNLFFSTNPETETLYSRIIPTDKQTEFLQNKWNELADYLIRNLEEISELPIKTWLQGSYKFGTVLAPLDKSEEYDVDLGVYFCWDTEKDPCTEKQLKSWVQESLLTFSYKIADVKKIEEPSKERCGRIYYKEQFHIDIPAYHLDENKDKRRLATNSKGWENSDPKAIHKWFINEVDVEDRPQIRRMVRYLKAWAVLKFEKDVRPSSILLTVLATEAFIELGKNDLDDEDAFCSIVGLIYERLSEQARVINPADDNDENLNRLEGDAFKNFLSKIKILRDISQQALQAEDEGDAALVWEQVFTHFMPLPEDSSIELVENGQQISIAPRISIEIRDQKNNQFINKFVNEVPSVPKDCRLIYRIENPQMIPQGATIDWVVRNEGDEAIAARDLGHSFRGTRNFENEERSAYFGRHFMDCIIRKDGNVIAVKRVPIFITGPSFKKKLSGVSSFRRFLKRKRR